MTIKDFNNKISIFMIGVLLMLSACQSGTGQGEAGIEGSEETADSSVSVNEQIEEYVYATGNTITFHDSTVVKFEDLEKKYRWNGVTKMFGDGQTIGGLVTNNGSTMTLSDEMDSADKGLAFSTDGWGYSTAFFGTVCIGNLIIRGDCSLVSGGILFHPNTTLTYME